MVIDTVKYLLDALPYWLVIWLSLDLLYLYLAGGWSEPTTFILWVELAALVLMPPFGFWKLYRFLKYKVR